MYLVGLYIYHKMIHGPYNVKFTVYVNYFLNFCLKLAYEILSKMVLTKNISAHLTWAERTVKYLSIYA